MIHLGKSKYGRVSFDLPTLIETRLLIQSNSGGGKSWAIRRLLEKSHGQVQQIVLDLEGEFNTLREKFDYILAGRGGDTAAEPKSAHLLARRLLELGVSAICDLYELKAHERVRFVRLFLESLISAPKSLWHPVLVVVDEAHHFAPEKGQAESASAVIDLVTRGRKRGLCGVLATQRLSKLHKDACAELLNKMVGRASLDIDQKRAADELGFIGRDERLALRNLKPGEFHCFGPGLRVGNTYQDGVVFTMVGNVQTRHPKIGDRRIQAPPEPTPKIKRLLAKLADLPAEAEEKAKTEADLRREIAQLKRELTIQKRSRGEKVVDTEQIEKWHQRASVSEKAVSESNKRIALAQRQLAKMSKGTGSFVEFAQTLSKQIADVQQIFENHHNEIKIEPIPRPTFRQPNVIKKDITNITVKIPDDDVPKSHLKVLNGLAWFENIGKDTVNRITLAGLIGMSGTAGGFGNYVRYLKQYGYIHYPRPGEVQLTSQGRELAITPDTPLSLAGLHDMCLSVLPKSHQKVLRVLLEIYPQAITRAEMGESVNMVHDAGGLGNYIRHIKKLGFIEYPEPNFMRASALLFPEGLE